MGAPFDGIWMLGIVALPLAVVGFAVMWTRRNPLRRGGTPSPELSPDDQAIEQLKSHYAEGQIDEEEFERRVESVLRH